MDWINDDVPYIITDEEHAAFKKLNTDEEREQFIDQFWERRNPEPGNPENKFKKEYYRRIVFANQHFSRRILGWKTDRGRIYILYGPPDEIQSEQLGGARFWADVGGSPRSGEFPYELWRYKHAEGLGSDIAMRFVDPDQRGEYQLTVEPDRRQLFLRGPVIGAKMMPRPVEEKPQRLDANITAAGLPRDSSINLRTAVTSRLAVKAIPISARIYSVLATPETDYTLLAFQIPFRRLQFQRRGEVMHAGLQIYGQFATPSGWIVNVFEKGLEVDVPEKDFAEHIDGRVAYLDAEPLRPGLYKLSVVVKDTQSGQMGSMEWGVRVPQFDTEAVTSSSLILADKIGPPEVEGPDSQFFQVGGNRVLANPGQVFSRDRGFGLYLEIYGLRIDPNTHKTSFAVEYRIIKEGKIVLLQDEEIQEPSIIHVLQKKFQLNSLPPGVYTIEVRITDHVRNQAISPSTSFDLT